VGYHPIDYGISDKYGNSIIATCGMMVKDVQPPTITCPSGVTVNADGDCKPVINFLPTVTDTCKDNIVPVQSSYSIVGSNVNVVFTASDGTNTATQTCTAAFKDVSQPKFATCPPIILEAQSGCTATVPDIPATDNCDQTIVGTPNQRTVTGVGPKSITFTAQDAAGNTNSITCGVTVNDNTAPVATCPSDPILTADDNCTAPVPPGFLPLTNDNCGPLTTTGRPSFATTVGTVNVQFIVSDGRSSTVANCPLTMQDKTTPKLTCPASALTLYANATCQADIPDSYMATAIDNCDKSAIPVTRDTNSVTGHNRHFITYSATDRFGNTESIQCSVQLQDVTSPSFVCPANPMKEASSLCTATIPPEFTPTVLDNCNKNIKATTSHSGTVTTLGPSNIPFSAEDGYGNSNSTTCTFTMVDKTPPEITCPLDPILKADAQCSAAIPPQLVATAKDNCDGTVTQATATQKFVNGIGFLLLSFSATDSSRNTFTRHCIISMVDETPPVFSACPADPIVQADAQCKAVLPASSVPTFVDNCDGSRITITARSSAFTALGPNAITFDATDKSGNSASAPCTFTMVDKTPPEITCPADPILKADAQCSAAIPPQLVATAKDNCDGTVAQATTAQKSVNGSDPSTSLVPFSITDSSGNTGTRNCSITVVDETPPIFSACPADPIVDADAQCKTILPTDFVPTFVDNCDGSRINITARSSVVTTLGPNAITFDANDKSGNSASAPCTFTMLDKMPPDFTCPADPKLKADAQCLAPIPITLVAKAIDNCDRTVTQATTTQAFVNGSDPSTSLVTFTATDLNNNTRTRVCNITVVDQTSPVFSACPADPRKEADAQCTTTVPAGFVPIVKDNCDNSVVATTTHSSVITALGPHTITFTAGDASGNADFRNCTFTMIDKLPPDITCPADPQLKADAQCSARIPDNYIATAKDNCDGTVTKATTTQTTVNGIGTSLVTFAVTDISGNTGTRNCSITLVDTIPPVITCPANLQLTAMSGCKSPLPATFVATATDNCDTYVMMASKIVRPSGITGPLPLGVTVVTFTTTDSSGNAASCKANVTVVDPDNDGACGIDDVCPSTDVAKEVASTNVKKDSWIVKGPRTALPGNLYNFAREKLTSRRYTTQSTGGCTCAQIVSMCKYTKGNMLKYGCPDDVMEYWTGLYGRAGMPRFMCVAKYQ
jgi:large repetitive protein